MIKIIAGIAMVALAGVANAALNAYEPFNYSTLVNGTAASGTGFTGNWSCGAAGSITAGLTYPGLSVANSSLSSGTSRQFVSLSTPLSSGTKWISFLYKASGNMGGNIDGVFFPNGNTTCLWFGFGLGPFSGTQGQLGLASMTTAGTAAQGASSLKQIGLGTYGATYLIVLRIDFDTSGANDTVTVYTNPVANASAPGIASVGTLTTYDVGAISKIGLNVQGGATITVDEIRVGDTYGDVVGYVPPPSAPTGLTAFPGVNAVGLSWNPTSGATGYKVLRGTSTGVYNTTNFVAANTNYDNTAVGGTTYFYVVEATNSSGASANSSEVSATPTIALPGAPAGLTAIGTNGAVLLNWSAGTGAASYNVKRSTSSGTETTITNVTATSYTDAAVINGTTYFYKVSSTNSAGESANTSETTATPNSPPAAPTGLAATAGTNQVSLSWTGSAGATSYNIKRSTTSGSGYVTIGTTTAPTVAYTDSTAVKFTQYFYVVSAVSAYGEGPNSSPEATATPLGSYGPTAYEPFNYALGTLANNTPSTGMGFTGNWNVSASPSIVAGLTYSNLPVTANAYQHAAAGAQTTENFASPLSSGTKFISFLFKGSGNSGGDSVGVFFKGNNATSLFAGFYSPFSSTSTGFGLGTVNSTSLGVATGLGSTPINNTAVHFIVVEIQFNTSGANDTVSLWIDPPTGVLAPGVAANVVNSAFDVGTISAFGINITGGYNPIIDEVRVGDVYGDVVGYGAAPVPTVPTSVSISVAQGKQVSWAAQSTNNYQPQRSSDNLNWTNFGGYFIGNASSSVYEATPQPYYRVLEFLPGGAGANVMVNGSFETSAANNVGAANWNGPASANGINEYVTNQYAALSPTDGSSLLYLEGTNGSGAQVSSDPFPINGGGLAYGVTFDAANPVKLNGANPQFQVEFLDAGNNFVGGSGFQSLASIGSSWTSVSNNYTAPATAVKMRLDFLEAVGGGGDWVTLIDNIKVSALATITGTNVLSPTLQLGAIFTGTVISNGVATATSASGSITFLTNGIALSTNTLALGSATSAAGILSPPYTVTAIYSGDGTFIGSTNSLTVSNAVATVTLNNLSQTYDGTAKSVTATTAPPGLTVNLAYNGSANAPTNSGTYQVIGTVSDAIYAGSATNNLVIAKAPASVTLSNLSQTYDGTPKSATVVTVPANLTVVFTYNGSTSAPVNIGTYQVIGLLSENNYYGGDTNSLVIVSGINNTPTNITAALSGNQLTLSWPADHRGWILQSQTNSLTTGLTTNWMDVPGSQTNIQSVIVIDTTNPTVFFRLRLP